MSVQDRFGGALTRLPVDLRRPVVHELASAGMSTRAIAPVVGVSKSLVAQDLNEVSTSGHLNIETGEVSDNFPAPEVLPTTPCVACGRSGTRQPSLCARCRAERQEHRRVKALLRAAARAARDGRASR